MGLTQRKSLDALMLRYEPMSVILTCDALDVYNGTISIAVHAGKGSVAELKRGECNLHMIALRSTVQLLLAGAWHSPFRSCRQRCLLFSIHHR